MVTGLRVTVQMTNKLKQTHSLKKLSIQVRLDGLSFFTQNHQHQVVDYAQFPFEKRVDPNQLLEQIEHIFTTQNVLNASYDEVVVLYVNKLFTLVPQPLFDQDKLTDYLKFNTKMLQTDFVTFDRIDPYEIVNVYIPYANVNNYFFDQFGSFTYHHAMTPLLQKVMQHAQLEGPALVWINLHPQSFEIVVTHQKKVLLANSFDYFTKEDFIYYLLFTLEQLDVSPDTADLRCSGKITTEDELYQLLYTYIRNVTLVASNNSHIAASDFLLSTQL